jgi:TatD DNase family protein
MIKLIPLDKMILQTMSPSCVIKPKHVSKEHVVSLFSQTKFNNYENDKLVIGRNEPCTMIQLVEAVAKIKDVEEKEVMEATWANSIKFIGK